MKAIVTTENFQTIFATAKSIFESNERFKMHTMARKNAKVYLNRAANCWADAKKNESEKLEIAIKNLQTVLNMFEKAGIEF